MPAPKPAHELCHREIKTRLNDADSDFIEALAATSGIPAAALCRHFIKQRIDAIKQSRGSFQLGQVL